MYILTPVLKTSRRLLLQNIVRYTFPNQAVFNTEFGIQINLDPFHFNLTDPGCKKQAV